jgi:hypothetical protein
LIVMSLASWHGDICMSNINKLIRWWCYQIKMDIEKMVRRPDLTIRIQHIMYLFCSYKNMISFFSHL